MIKKQIDPQVYLLLNSSSFIIELSSSNTNIIKLIKQMSIKSLIFLLASKHIKQTTDYLE